MRQCHLFVRRSISAAFKVWEVGVVCVSELFVFSSIIEKQRNDRNLIVCLRPVCFVAAIVACNHMDNYSGEEIALIVNSSTFHTGFPDVHE
jgi:hypothetical protein